MKFHYRVINIMKFCYRVIEQNIRKGQIVSEKQFSFMPRMLPMEPFIRYDDCWKYLGRRKRQLHGL